MARPHIRKSTIRIVLRAPFRHSRRRLWCVKEGIDFIFVIDLTLKQTNLTSNRQLIEVGVTWE